MLKACPDLLNMWEGTAVHQLVHQLPKTTFTPQVNRRDEFKLFFGIYT